MPTRKIHRKTQGWWRAPPEREGGAANGCRNDRTRGRTSQPPATPADIAGGDVRRDPGGRQGSSYRSYRGYLPVYFCRRRGCNHRRSRSELCDAPVLEHEQLVGDLHDGRSVSDDDDDGAVLARTLDCADKGPLADRVKVCVRLVEHDEARLVVEA